MKVVRFAMLLAAGLAAGCQTNSSRTGIATVSTSGNSAPTNTPHATAILHVQGMSCPLCANNIDKQLLGVRGVEKVTVDLGTGQVKAKLSPANPPTREELAAAIQRSGFTLDRIDMPAERSAP